MVFFKNVEGVKRVNVEISGTGLEYVYDVPEEGFDPYALIERAQKDWKEYGVSRAIKKATFPVLLRLVATI